MGSKKGTDQLLMTQCSEGQRYPDRGPERPGLEGIEEEIYAKICELIVDSNS